MAHDPAWRGRSTVAQISQAPHATSTGVDTCVVVTDRSTLLTSVWTVSVSESGCVTTCANDFPPSARRLEHMEAAIEATLKQLATMQVRAMLERSA